MNGKTPTNAERNSTMGMCILLLLGMLLVFFAGCIVGEGCRNRGSRGHSSASSRRSRSYDDDRDFRYESRGRAVDL